MQQEHGSAKKDAMYFVATVLPKPVAASIMTIKHEFAEKYNSKKPLNSPAHLTLITPFYFPDLEIEKIKIPLQKFSTQQTKFNIKLSGFGVFLPKTIYVDVAPNEKLELLYKDLSAFVISDINFLKRYLPKKFTPHITVGNRDLTKGNFKKAWDIYGRKKFEKEFEANNLMLLRHNGNYWETFCELPFGTEIL